jgi:hypothetical protein
MEGYFFNVDWNWIKKKGYEATGSPGILISLTPLTYMPHFEDEIRNVIKKANPDLKTYDFFAVFYRDNKEEIGKLEKTAKTCSGESLDGKHFYIVQPLKENNKKALTKTL